MRLSLRMNSIKIIIVEDELISAEYLKEILEESGAEVIDIIDNGKEAIRICTQKKPDVIFMDIMLRDHISGSEAALEISRQIDTKIIFLTAYMDDEMIDYAVEANAAGYLTKPYNEKQIIATLRLATEHHTPKPEPEQMLSNEIHLKNGFIYLRHEKRLLKDAKEIELGPKAQKLIALLCSQPNISISNEQIEMQIWGSAVNDKTLRSLIFRIRALTDDELIKNISGTGYLIQL